MQIATEASQVRTVILEAKSRGQRVGLVPTMGALHAGHLSLIKAAQADCDLVTISIFVNPTQFAPIEDLREYPRQLEQDAQIAEQAGADLIFAPAVEEMYPEGFSTYVAVEELTEGLCGCHRPGHFRGVATVVAKLLNIVQPAAAYFGEKDYQQLEVIKRLVRDLDIPVEILGRPTVRELDGLAVSSRSQYLNAEERAAAPLLYQALRAGAEVVSKGATGAQAAERVRQMLTTEPMFRVQYIEAVHPETLQPVEQGGPPMVIAAAAYLGDTRLIDNIIIEEGSNDAQSDD